MRIAGHLGAAYHPEWVRGLRAVAFAHLGHARRALGELASAGDAFDLGARLRAGGAGSPAVEAEALALEALLERDRHRLVAAAAMLEKAYLIYRGGEGGAGGPEAADPEAADPHLAGSALAHRAWCLYHLGRHECAARLLEEAEGLVDEGREPRLLLGIRQGRVWSGIAFGTLEAAKALLPAAAELAGRAGDDGARLRLRRGTADPLERAGAAGGGQPGDEPGELCRGGGVAALGGVAVSLVRGAAPGGADAAEAGAGGGLGRSGGGNAAGGAGAGADRARAGAAAGAGVAARADLVPQRLRDGWPGARAARADAAALPGVRGERAASAAAMAGGADLPGGWGSERRRSGAWRRCGTLSGRRASRGS